MLIAYNKPNSARPGEITRTSSLYLPQLPGLLRDKGHSVLITDQRFDQTLVYVDAKGNIIQRPQMPITVSKSVIKPDGKDTAVFKGVPKGSELYVGGKLVPDFTGQTLLELVSDTPEVYNLRFVLWPYLDYVMEVHAREA